MEMAQWQTSYLKQPFYFSQKDVYISSKGNSKWLPEVKGWLEKKRKRFYCENPELISDDAWNNSWDVKDDNTVTTFGKYF